MTRSAFVPNLGKSRQTHLNKSCLTTRLYTCMRGFKKPNFTDLDHETLRSLNLKPPDEQGSKRQEAGILNMRTSSLCRLIVDILRDKLSSLTRTQDLH